jgi:hypothetical protein
MALKLDICRGSTYQKWILNPRELLIAKIKTQSIQVKSPAEMNRPSNCVSRTIAGSKWSPPSLRLRKCYLTAWRRKERPWIVYLLNAFYVLFENLENEDMKNPNKYITHGRPLVPTPLSPHCFGRLIKNFFLPHPQGNNLRCFYYITSVNCLLTQRILCAFRKFGKRRYEEF